MITSTDIGNALYRDIKPFGMQAYQGMNMPKGEVKAERIVIHTKALQSETICLKSFAEVNLVVPDINGHANLIRLNELEREAVGFFDYTGEYDGTTYDVEIHSTGIIKDTGTRSHYVNVRLLIRVLNVK